MVASIRPPASRSAQEFQEAEPDFEPDILNARPRTEANIAAMRLAADLRSRPRALTQADRRILGAYTGWGGIDLTALAGKFPPGFPEPHGRGMIHEYFTPSDLCAEIARVVRPLLPDLADEDGEVFALEPSVGIGRFLRATEGPGFEALRWRAVEWSPVSAAMVQSMYPEIDVHEGTFESWVAAHEPEIAGLIRLILANPPYGERGPSRSDDPDRSYRSTKDGTEQAAYAYFLRRASDLMAPNGLSVWVIPSGFMTGQSTKLNHRGLRTAVLLRHHLAAAYRLPSGIFAGASGSKDPGKVSTQKHILNIDVVFLRARGGKLDAILPEDRFILDGNYYEKFPDHILGEEVSGKHGHADPRPKDKEAAKKIPAYQIVGRFSRLPDLVERPTCTTCTVMPLPRKERKAKSPTPIAAAEIDPRLLSASKLGARVGRYLADVSAQQEEVTALAWNELHGALLAWTKAHGVPGLDVDLVKFAERDQGAQRFLTAFETASAKLVPALRAKPVFEQRYRGRSDDVVALAEFLYRQHRRLVHADLRGLDVGPLFDAGWAEDEGHLLPPDVYYSGLLWPRYDRAIARANAGDKRAAGWARKLLGLIKPAVFDDIQVLTPRQAWVPLDLIEGWLNEYAPQSRRIPLMRESGLVQVKGLDYDSLDAGIIAAQIIGWINHDRGLFVPHRDDDEKLDEARVRVSKDWEAAFFAYCGQTPERRAAVERAYQRSKQGYVQPVFPDEPLPIASWGNVIKLKPHQVAGARRLLANNGGLLGYGVGVGKTYTALAFVLAARQEGRCRRPVIWAPNSVVWQWVAEAKNAAPNLRVGVIGAKLVRRVRGKRKGQWVSETDTAAERARKWTEFMAGDYDLIIQTHSSVARTRMDEAEVEEYALAQAAIQRDIRLRQRAIRGQKGRIAKAEAEGRELKKGKLSPRDEEVLREGSRAWIKEVLELPPKWEYDPGVTWSQIGCDLLVIDEAHWAKGTNKPEPREGGVPKYMGNPGEGSDIGWQVMFRCASVRKRTGGSGVVLLTATPAPNSPLEMLNMLQLVTDNPFGGDAEQFIDRYFEIERETIANPKGQLETRGVVTGFRNKPELLDVVLRYGDFKSPRSVGLKLPDPKQSIIEVDKNDEQRALYRQFVADLKAIDRIKGPKKPSTLGIQARMAMVAIHPALNDGYAWTAKAGKWDEDKEEMVGEKKAASEMTDVHCPKFDKVAEIIKARPGCGHIVFLENTAAQWWLREVLVDSGIPRERIAVLNSDVAKDLAVRQRIAAEFNGIDGERIAVLNAELVGVPEAERNRRILEELDPKYDVLIANKTAEVGMNLQYRSCTVIDVDLPWNPASLEQRHGRAVRQGSTQSIVAVPRMQAWIKSSEPTRAQRFQAAQRQQVAPAARAPSSAKPTAKPPSARPHPALPAIVDRIPPALRGNFAHVHVGDKPTAKPPSTRPAPEAVRPPSARPVVPAPATRIPAPPPSSTRPSVRKPASTRRPVTVDQTAAADRIEEALGKAFPEATVLVTLLDGQQAAVEIDLGSSAGYVVLRAEGGEGRDHTIEKIKIPAQASITVFEDALREALDGVVVLPLGAAPTSLARPSVRAPGKPVPPKPPSARPAAVVPAPKTPSARPAAASTPLSTRRRPGQRFELDGKVIETTLESFRPREDLPAPSARPASSRRPASRAVPEAPKSSVRASQRSAADALAEFDIDLDPLIEFDIDLDVIGTFGPESKRAALDELDLVME